MKKLITVLLMLSFITVMSQPRDKGLFIEPDKQAHFVYGGFAGFSGYAIACSFTENRWERMGVGLLVGGLLGLGKEGIDSRPGGSGFDWGDLAYTGFGAAVGAFTFDLLNSDTRKKKAIEKIEQMERDRLASMTDDEKLLNEFGK